MVVAYEKALRMFVGIVEVDLLLYMMLPELMEKRSPMASPT